MKDVILGVLTDASMRDHSATENAFMQEAVGIPWSSVE